MQCLIAMSEKNNLSQWAHSQTAKELATHLSTDPLRGLANLEAARRLAEEGPNSLKEEKPVTFWELLSRQFASFLIAILLLAGVISLLVGEVADSLLILAIVILNAAVGTFQELCSERALKALMEAVAPTAWVLRDGVLRQIAASELVPGDGVVLHAGDLVPADLRLTESHSLAMDESPLTGESEPVKKSPQRQLEQRTAVADRVNCAYMGTSVSYGRGTGIVFAPGMDTQLGQIARMISSQRRAQTPLQRKLSELGTWLGIGALVLCGIIFLTGLLRGLGLFEMFLVAVSLAVAAVPEGLPAVVTIALALGLQRMLKRHALIRRLAAVETLGEATVICTDKTGTLTRGVMEVERIYLAGREYRFQQGTPISPEAKAQLETPSPFKTLLLAIALCNDAVLQKATDGSLVPIGSPTEIALARASRGAGLEEKNILEHRYPRVAEVPFDSKRKRMATGHKMPNGKVAVFAKGAPDAVLPFCTKAITELGERDLNDKLREQFLTDAEALAAQAYRLLAVAYREEEDLARVDEAADLERDLTLLGLVGLMDPPRPQTAGAVAECKLAGIRPIMVTGDHGKTALAIATATGMLNDTDQFLSGSQIDEMTQAELRRALQHTRVFARVSPHHKLRIVEALQDHGEVVAMTGDGANDAPALKKANIGIAMGIRGTDVSKEAADMVLTDDNFQSIVAAVHEGRVIYSNICKVVMYLLSCNLGEILAVFIGMISGLPLLLKPIQILWLNLVTDGLPALALSVEKEEPGIMLRKPRDPKEGILKASSFVILVSQGMVIAGVTLLAFYVTLRSYPGEVARAQTAAFLTLSLSELFRAYAFRTEMISVFAHGLFSNRSMIGATLVSTGLLLAVIYIPVLQEWFRTVIPEPTQWWYIAPLILFPFAVAEITRTFMSSH